MTRRLMTVCCAILVVALSACSETKAPEKAAEAPKAPEKAVEKPKTDGVAVPSAQGKSDPECVGPIDTGVPETVTIGGKTVEVNGYKATLQGAADADESVVIGVIANANEASGENLFNLKRYLQFFADNKAELVVIAGDSGDDRVGIEAVLRTVAESGLPVIAVAGNRETKADFVDAMNAVRKEKPNLLNGNRVRYLDWDDVDLVTLPGYHDPRYIHAGAAGCQYFAADVRALEKVASAANNPVLLVSHGGPKGTAPSAIDVIADKSNVGDSAINDLVTATKIPFGIFPNIKEAGGRAQADLSGAQAVAEGAASATLYLNPGSADSLPWTMNDGATAQGMAALVTVSGKQASYKLYKAAALTDADKAAAAKLAPAPAPAEGAEAKAE